MKRFYVRLDFRGQKLGRLLAQAAITAGKSIGYALMRVDTLASMGRANRLYQSSGFRRIKPYRHNPIDGAIYMESGLT